MNQTTEHRSKRHRRVLSVAALAIFAPSVALADDQTLTPFKMGVVEDKALGRSIQSGKYDKAIARLTTRSPATKGTFSSQNNLCVAYVKTARFDKAAEACEAAVDRVKTLEARVAKKSARSLESRAYRSDLAVALSNRGVLLAISGDATKARADFQAAIKLGSRHARFAANNLQRLDLDADD